MGKAASYVGGKVGSGLKYAAKKAKSAVSAVTTAAKEGFTYDTGHKAHTWDLFAYNYDTQSGGAKQSSIEMFHAGQKGKQLIGNGYQVSVTCEGCFAHITAGIEFELKANAGFSGINVDHLLMAINGRATGALNLHAHAEAQYHTKKTVNIMPRRSIGNFEIPVAMIPVYLSTFIKLDAQVTFTSHAVGDARFGLSYEKSVRMGAEYRSAWGQMRSFKTNKGPGLSHSGPTLTFEGKADLRGTLIPELEVQLYHVMPLKFRVKPYMGLAVNAKGSLDLKTQTMTACYNVYGAPARALPRPALPCPALPVP